MLRKLYLSLKRGDKFLYKRMASESMISIVQSILEKKWRIANYALDLFNLETLSYMALY